MLRQEGSEPRKGGRRTEKANRLAFSADAPAESGCAAAEINPLCSTKAESDELLLLVFGLCSKGEDLRMQKFCHLLMGVAFLISTLLTDSSEFD